MRRTFFGVHDSDPVGSWPQAPVGALRVWDAGVAWNQVERAPGVFDFGRLDAIVAAARSHGSDVLLVLGQTPSFYTSARPPAAAYGPGASAMPPISAWKRYVARVAARYRGKHVQFQVWNEANVVNYWSGTPAQMARLTAAARQAIDSVNPRATLLAPAMVTRLTSQQQWFDRFWGQRVRGRPVADYVDVVSLQLYPAADDPRPEAAMELLAADRRVLAQHGVDKPIWNTEINYGLTGGGSVRRRSPARQAANVATTYVLNAAAGVARVFWYAWDLAIPIADTYTSTASGELTGGGRAYAAVRRWLLARPAPACTSASDGTWTCVSSDGVQTWSVVWNPRGPTQLTVPAKATRVESLDGRSRPLTDITSIAVGPVPVLVVGTVG